ncbi:hypothetical protein [Chryseobacterium sp.]|uniref:hypothetical protein n=1 Tax=Chryseobacterium sp. TaxID=1871047 RepID=UPI00262EA076|nr:hypothetical protein [Chryseobacterium sp.]
MKKYLLFLILVTSMSCHPTKNLLNVYIHNSSVDGGEIFGNPKESFFGKKASDIKKLNVQNANKYITELTLIKEKLINSPYSFNSHTLMSVNGDDMLDGYYTHAFVWGNNTLYSDDTMKSWLYIDESNNIIKTIYYESKSLAQQLK